MGKVIDKLTAAAARAHDLGEMPEAPPDCIICGGDLRVLGFLADTLFYRCRSCGMEYSSDSGSLAESQIAINAALAIMRGGS